jgi:peptide/nickel transport system substrate-binding protein
VLDADRRLGYALNPYLVFNMRSPNGGGAMRNLAVRRAIAYAIDKAGMVRFLDNMNIGTVTVPAHTAIPFGNTGHREYDLYPTPGARGDRERSRALLAEAGYADGLTLKALYRDECPHDSIAKAYAQDLAAVGITVEPVFGGTADEYYRILQDPARAAAGDWDVTAAAWTPDWFGNNGRAYVQPMFQSGFVPGTSNYGGYDNPEVDALILRALSEPDADRAADLWHEVDRRVLEDAAIVPILACEPTILHMTSARVRNARPMPQIDRWLDAANLWLDPPA